MPLATNMCVVSFADIAPAFRAGAVGVVLSDHHFWGGLRDTLALGTLCASFDIGLSMHSNSHLGISLAAMVHVAGATRQLTYACDTHWPWKTTDIVEPGVAGVRRRRRRGPDLARAGRPPRPRRAGPRARALHPQRPDNRDDVSYMRRFVPDFTPNMGRW